MSERLTHAALRMPAEWEQHEATWLAWPHQESDWLDSFPKIKFVYCEIVKSLCLGERVEILCDNDALKEQAAQCLSDAGISEQSYRLHLVKNDRGWLRDSAPTSVISLSGSVSWVAWKFNAWARYEDYAFDALVPNAVAEISGLPIKPGLQPESGKQVVLEGGAIDSDGQGTLLATEECLLSSVQQRNPGFSKQDYQTVFSEYLGVKKCIWLNKGVPGDDTHGHIDGICRFVDKGKVLLCTPRNGDQELTAIYDENKKRLLKSTDALGKPIEVIDLPLPREIYYQDQLLPASYANFYIANNIVLVPVFKDANDEPALRIFENLYPEREIVDIDCSDLIVGMGALHCITQPQFA
jgi:agmatine deiminase